MFSCARRVETGYKSIAYVDKVLSDSLAALRGKALLAGKPSGSVVLMGDPMRCLSLSEEMMGFDEFDNVDARRVKDGLPDFAGERIVSIMDITAQPYDSLSAEGKDSLFFREAAVRGALASLDSTLDCKVLVLCSPQLAIKGGADVADLFEKIGCDVPVICSADTAFSFSSACFKVMRDRNLFTHNITYPSALLTILRHEEGQEYPKALVFDENLVPAALADTVGVFAQNTYVSHVQNKHNSGRNR